MKKLALWFVVSAAAMTASLQWLGGSVPGQALGFQEPALTPARATAQGGQGALPALPPEVSPRHKRRSGAALDEAATFSALESRLARGDIDPAQALHYLNVAAEVCEGVRNRPHTKAGPANTVSLRTYYASAARFCTDPSPDPDIYLERLLRLDQSDVVVAQQLASDAYATLPESQRELAENIVLGSLNPSAILAAASVLAEPAVSGGWEMGADLSTGPGESQALPKAQWLAAQMIACDLSGGCGADGLTTLIECGSFSVCEPGITTREVWRRTSTPVEFGLAERIYSKLKAARAAPGAA